MMLRSALNRSTLNKSLIKLVKPNGVMPLQCVRCQSSVQQSGSSLKIGLLLGSAVVLTSGGAIAYGYKHISQIEEELLKSKDKEQIYTKQIRTLNRQLTDAKESEKVLAEKFAQQMIEKENVTKDNIIEEKSIESNEEIIEKLEDESIADKYGDNNAMRISLEDKYKRMLKKVREELDEELRHHLKRQLAAHHDHLHEQLHTLANELNRKHQSVLEDTVLNEKLRSQSELANSMNRLQTIEGILKVRDQLDKEEKTAKQLWVLCQTLFDALKHSSVTLKGDYNLKPLAKDVEEIEKTLKEYSNNLLATIAVNSIPKDALENGVYSEDDLINRFTRIERICRRVALIGDDGGSLFKYFLSYLQSFFIIGESKIPIEELTDQVIDPSQWDTFDVLARVKHCLKFNNLEMALRYANQLKGEPRNVAKDWIRDARVHLETRQAAQLLLSQAESIGLQVIK